jgi:hypothetical protein
MHEEVLESSQKRYSSRPTKDYARFNKYDRDFTKTSSSADKGIGGPVVTTVDGKSEGKSDAYAKVHDKFSSLKAARRAKGECFKCGTKWAPGHKCAQSIPLHLMEEVLELFTEQQEQDHHVSDLSDSDSELLSLSLCAAAGACGKKSIRLHGLAGKQELLILIDSGSSASFISKSVVDRMSLPTQSTLPVQVAVASRAKMLSIEIVEHFSWLTQGQTFSTSLRFLPLQCYDIVLGMDWLETFSPMWIYWKRKILRFTHKGNRVQLHGVKPTSSSCYKISVKQLHGLVRKGGVSQLLQLSPVLEAPVLENTPPPIQLSVRNMVPTLTSRKRRGLSLNGRC